MSLASATGQVIFSQKGGVYMPAIQCNQGDLYQEYMGEASAPTNIAPDFASLKPVLSFILTSSRVAEGLVVPSSMKWYFNDVEIKFSGNVSTNTFGGETGHFKFIPYQPGTTDYTEESLKSIGDSRQDIHYGNQVQISNTVPDNFLIFHKEHHQMSCKNKTDNKNNINCLNVQKIHTNKM